jgi:putative addiction module CopG family antidote
VPTLTISLTDEMESFIVNRIDDGRFRDAGEVVQAALMTLQREEREADLRLSRLRASIDEGESSGIADGNAFLRIRQLLQPAAGGK